MEERFEGGTSAALARTALCSLIKDALNYTLDLLPTLPYRSVSGAERHSKGS